MAGTPNLGLTYLTSGQLQPEVTINADLNAIDGVLGAQTSSFANNPLTTSLLTYGYYGGNLYVNGRNVAVANGTIALTASTTNYIQRTAQGVVSVNTTGFTSGLIPMASVATNATAINTITDARPAVFSRQAYQTINVGAPTGIAVATATTGGTLAAATYTYRVSAVYPWGESAASAEYSVATTGTTSENTISWTLPAGATSAKVYGRTSGAELLIATVAAGTSSYLDTGSVTPSGALPSGSMALVDLNVNCDILGVQGTITGNTTLVFPLYTQKWIVANGTTGAFPLSVATANGSPITIPQSETCSLYGNGTVLVYADSMNAQVPGQPPSAVGVGASPFAYTATSNGALAVSGGTVSNVTLARNAVSVFSSSLSGSSGMVLPLRVGDVATITYSAAPTVYMLPD